MLRIICRRGRTYLHSPASPWIHAIPEAVKNGLFDKSKSRCYSLTTDIDHHLHASHPSSLPNHALHEAVRTTTGGPDEDGRDPEPEHEHDGISDREWDIRTGRAIDILQQTLPGFFHTGLISTTTPTPGAESTSNGTKGKGRGYPDHEEGIYSRRIRLEYIPPIALPVPFPRVLTVEGLPLYVASSVFVRHTLNALYTELEVELRKVAVRPQPPSVGPSSDKSNGRGIRRDKSAVVGMVVSGTARMSGARAEWDIVSTYTFSPRTGLVAVHTVNSIHPAPHETVYDALRASLVKLRLTGPAGGGEKGAGAAISATAVEQSGMAVGESSGDPREIKPRS